MEKISRRRVLIIDDDNEFLQELNETLDLSGYDVVVENDAMSAVEMAAKTKPDVILLDLKMKGMTGFEVANKLKHVNKTMGIPVIAMSGFFTENKDITLLNFFDITNYLQKPFTPLDVIAQIEDVLKLNKAEA